MFPYPSLFTFFHFGSRRCRRCFPTKELRNSALFSVQSRCAARYRLSSCYRELALLAHHLRAIFSPASNFISHFSIVSPLPYVSILSIRAIQCSRPPNVMDTDFTVPSSLLSPAFLPFPTPRLRIFAFLPSVQIIVIPARTRHFFFWFSLIHIFASDFVRFVSASSLSRFLHDRQVRSFVLVLVVLLVYELCIIRVLIALYAVPHIVVWISAFRLTRNGCE